MTGFAAARLKPGIRPSISRLTPSASTRRFMVNLHLRSMSAAAPKAADEIPAGRDAGGMVRVAATCHGAPDPLLMLPRPEIWQGIPGPAGRLRRR